MPLRSLFDIFEAAGSTFSLSLSRSNSVAAARRLTGVESVDFSFKPREAVIAVERGLAAIQLRVH